MLVVHAAKSLAAMRLGNAVQPYTLAGGQALLTSKKPFNTFAAELSPLMRRYFTSTAQNSDPDIYIRGYVGSDDITEYDRILEALLKERIASHRGSLSQELTPTRGKEPKLAAAIEKFKTERPVDGHLQLITGGVGTENLYSRGAIKELLQPEEQKKWTHWAFIDFNPATPLATPLDASATNWMCENSSKALARKIQVLIRMQMRT